MGLVTSDERSFYWRLTGWQNLIFFSRLHGIDKADARRRIAELLERFELKDLANRRFHEFSTGNRQRLAIVRALLTDPPLLLLDEPTRSLDPLAADELRRLVLEWVDSSQQKTVLITTHNLAEIEQLCGRVAILSRNTLKECASVAELRLKYSSRMDVILHIRRIATEDNLIQLQTKVPTLTWKNVPPDTMEVQFSKKPEDGTLDLVLNNLRRSGAEILDCHTVRRGLKEIMEEIEQEA
jgi:ABC-2 type transport system ATP-binding protein